jgi:hypothetical protein
MSHPTPKVPVSWGELVDKLTILEIKQERLTAEAARRNVARELALIGVLADKALAGDNWLRDRKAALKSVNETLWEIEDRIREKEAAGEFDEVFIELARSVYKRNDERARIKKDINAHLASEIVEEKSYREY